ncbi:MAG: methyltransferase domain-containing protein [Anaerolineae bacterium]|jgi:SAM-dependent methyltransferase|nr:methyltransferase domain-containing protein [Anaerolineae bacterium]
MTDFNPRTDRDILTKQAYATDEHLALRYRTHELYSQPKIDFHKWVIECLTWRGDEWVLDVGAGPGSYGSYFELVQEHAPRGRHAAGDLSFSMAQKARQHPHAGHMFVLAMDVQALPFPDDTFDVVLANHMLHHVPDVEQALTEIRRVLRPSGCLVAASNSQDTMPEFDTLARRTCTLLGSPKQFKTPPDSFTLENGTVLLGRHFRAVARHDLPSALHFPEVEPVLAYLNSVRAIREPQLPEEISWADFMDTMEKQILRLIRHFGELQVHKLTGVLVATDGGGFAADYLRLLNGSNSNV